MTVTPPQRALVIDDEALIRWVVSETLSQEGIAVEQAGDGASAIRAVEAADQPFDAVVVDLRLPDVDDLSLLRTLRTRLPGAVIVLMTAFGTPQTIADAEALGVTVIHKPFEVEAIRAAVLQPSRREDEGEEK
jgi:DNA-binding NtrC family response regulator